MASSNIRCSSNLQGSLLNPYLTLPGINNTRAKWQAQLAVDSSSSCCEHVSPVRCHATADAAVACIRSCRTGAARRMDDAMWLLLVHTILQNASNRLAYTSGNKFLSGLFRYTSVTSIHSPTNLLGGTGNPASCKSASHNLVLSMKNNLSRVAWMREPAIMERAFESREFSA